MSWANTSFTSLDLVNKTVDLKLSEKPWKGLVETGFKLDLDFNYIRPFFELSNLPVTTTEYSYWDTNLGIRSKNLLEDDETSTLKGLDFYLSYSPFYGGNYLKKRTLKMGTGMKFFDYLWVDLFAMDNISIGGSTKFQFKNFDLMLFTYERSYDDYHFFQSRAFGANLSVKF